MKAIETEYAGYRFRSRLEARWAVFFDALGIEWKYEVQGFQNDAGDRYLPDFYLPGSETWVEVKGDKDALVNDHARQVRLHDGDGALPGMKDSVGTSRGLLLLGDVPHVRASDGFIHHPIIQHRKGLHRSWASFLPIKQKGTVLYVEEGQGLVASLADLAREEGAESDASLWRVEVRSLLGDRHFPQLVSAYQDARSARFEHGQSGALR